jgi:hypothetical protein
LKELPTIAEQSITAAQTRKEEHKSIQDVFPAQLPSRKRSRVRTSSESHQPATKFVISAVKSPTKEGTTRIPRNQSAPHFTLAQRSHQGLPRVGSHAGSGLMLQNHGQMHKSTTKITLRPLARKDIFYTGSVSALSDNQQEDDHEAFKSQVSVRGGMKSNKHSYISVSGLRANRHSFVSVHRGSLVNSALALPMISEGRRRTSIGVRSQQSEMVLDPDGGGMIAALKEMMNFKLLKDPLFLLMGISNVFGMMGFYTPFVYLPNMAQQYGGISMEDAAFLISVIGISNTLGRVISGWVSDFPWVNSLVVTNIAIILSAITVFLFPFCGAICLKHTQRIPAARLERVRCQLRHAMALAQHHSTHANRTDGEPARPLLK